ncbi:hypothetical protein Scep_030890 [Stephania cephalantha]|uniref:Protein GFS12 n=1 Tax=Stephania cephalantha TaxID=152367 RepID=A0AAP0HEU4_9MAGN
MEAELCFECLQRQIHHDFSQKLTFCYGISHSALPFASAALIQVFIHSIHSSPFAGSGGDSAQFVLVRLSDGESGCLRKYVDGYSVGSVEDDTAREEDEKDDNGSLGIESGQGDVNVGNVGNETKFLNFIANGTTECLMDCHNSRWFSCARVITALAPVAHIGSGSYSAVESIARNVLSGSLEDHVMSSLNLIIEGKPSGRDGMNFLSLIGVPSYSEKNIPGCVRHPNIVPVLGMLKTPGYINLLLPRAPYTLENILHYSPDALVSEWHKRFLIYQLLSALSYVHGLGIAHGNLCPSSVMLNSSSWCWLDISNTGLVKGKQNTVNEEESRTVTSSRLNCMVEDCPGGDLYADLKLSYVIDWPSDFKRWSRGEISNFEYLLVLNRLAGRRWGDHTFHTVMPWVIDFSTKPDENSDASWRDLEKSKWRLAKGDEQLDFTYSTSEIPHHVSDECLSELAVCSYKARRLPLSILRMAVRSVYEPNEYPSNMQRLYQWTPDECIPEFYSDPRIFYSIHSGMSNLAVPSWASDPEEFIKLHRDALESDRVSQRIHHWIDITFGYMMSGQAAIAAKNVMLPSSEHFVPKALGRRQLFTQPHPTRHFRKVSSEKSLLLETINLQEWETTASFCEHTRHLSPVYYCDRQNSMYGLNPVKGPESNNLTTKMHMTSTSGRELLDSSDIDLSAMLEYIEVDDHTSLGFQELLLWRQKSSDLGLDFEGAAPDIFSVGCLLAEVYLKKPLFNPDSLGAYMDSGVLPGSIQELPPNALLLVEACIQRDWRRRPSVKCLLESPYFPATIRSSYLFLSALHLLAKSGSRLQYISEFARQGALNSMGSFAAEMCAPYCIPYIIAPLKETEVENAFILLNEFLKCLKPLAIKTLILPAIQKILQANYSHLKVSLLQDSFVRELWNRIGKQAYLDMMHPLVISNLLVSTHKNSVAAASVLLIGSSEELGVPVTYHQTILPLIQCFGKGLCTDGIDVLVRIGGLLGESFIVRQLIPALRNVILSCIDVSNMDKPEPMQSWNSLAFIDSLLTLNGVIALLSSEVIIKEMVQDGSCIHVKVLKQSHLDLQVLQVAATTLIEICKRIGPDLCALHILPQLKELFDELVFSQDNGSSSSGRILSISKSKVNMLHVESRMDLVVLLYPAFASLLGIEKLRQCCATWLLLEQFLQQHHNWKWEYTRETSKSGADHTTAQRPHFGKIPTSDHNPAKMLLNGVGWSIPQSQGRAKNLISLKHGDSHQHTSSTRHAITASTEKCESWFWYPNVAASWDRPDFLGRIGGLKDEQPWKIRSSIIHAARAHPGALRSLAVSHDECTVFTGGVGPGFKGTVQKWELPRMKSTSGYYGHDEVVNDISILSSTGRIASCDGTIHIWNSQTAKLISVHAEQSTSSSHTASTSSSASKVNTEHINMLNSNTLSNGVLSSAFGGNLYTCIHYLDHDEKLIAGTGNGSLRFIDIAHDKKLQLWKTESVEASFSSLISAICSCGSQKMQGNSAASSPSWIAAGLNSGHCRLLDARSGSIIASWLAHDGFVTKLAAPEDHLLVSSSLDKTLRVWDLRRSWPSQSTVFRGYSDGVSGFSVWGQDVISISRNKIGVSSLSRCMNEEGQQRVSLQKLYVADRGTINFSPLLSISILPFSRLFLVGTEDGHLKICC